ncbi:GlxA family transcriptional regulator [Vibrio viridaestus]|uniref:Helix-turn-helix domain-containing protein n=1 Tax=Vibrio viridaestus TaxID=2487322 RepID=A0A3N9TDN7_9VIBR|nr:helix-turn-helix domain-containing protein [Vibrio viridaestus]RQW61813.1 helix-turn-helix domain-containing protein [Vibrio viridaestus]
MLKVDTAVCQPSKTIGIHLPADIPFIELSFVVDAFKLLNRLSNDTCYELFLLTSDEQNPHTILCKTFDLPLWEESKPVDSIWVLSATLPPKAHIKSPPFIQHQLNTNQVNVVGVNAGSVWLHAYGVNFQEPVVAHWNLWDDINEKFPALVLTPELYQIGDNVSSGCGQMATSDLIIAWLTNLETQDTINSLADLLCVDRLRHKEEKQRLPSLSLGGEDIQPRLTMAIELMENNIEEPLSTDEIAVLVHISRRQLERLFKRYTGTLPARYYMQIRLKKAKHLVLTTGKSIVQIGLICGFSSGPHFSSSYKAYFGVTPREERAKRL